MVTPLTFVIVVSGGTAITIKRKRTSLKMGENDDVPRRRYAKRMLFCSPDKGDGSSFVGCLIVERN